MANKKVSTQSVTKEVAPVEVKEVAKVTKPVATETKQAEPVEVKEPVKKATPATKKTEKKTTARTTKKAPARKTTAAKKEAKAPEIYVEFDGNQVNMADVMTRIENDWVEKGNKKTTLKDVSIYVQPETDRVYYVVNAGTSKEVRGDVSFL